MPLAARAWQQGRLWVNDPDCVVARPVVLPAGAVGPGRPSPRRAALVLGPRRRPRRRGGWTRSATSGRRRHGPRRLPRPTSSRRPRRWPRRRGRRGERRDRPAGRAHRAVPPAAATRWTTPTVTRRLVALAETYVDRCRPRSMEPPTHRTGCLITYGDGIRRARRGAAAHAGRLPARPRGRPAQRRPPAADLPVDLRRRVRGRRPPGWSTPPSAPGTTSRDLAGEHGVMLDFVANHTSSHSPWFPAGWPATRPTPASTSSATPTSTSRRWCGLAPRRSSIPSRGRTAARPGPGRRSARTRSTSTSATRRTLRGADRRAARVPRRGARPRSGWTRSASCGRSRAPPACTCPRPTR